MRGADSGSSGRCGTVAQRVCDVRIAHVGRATNIPPVPAVGAGHPIDLNEGCGGEGLCRAECSSHVGDVRAELGAHRGGSGTTGTIRCPGIDIHITAKWWGG